MSDEMKPANDQFDSPLEMAWRRYAELDLNASTTELHNTRLQVFIMLLAVTATLLALLTDRIGADAPVNFVPALRILLIVVPIVGMVALAFASKLQHGDRSLALRAGAEEIEKSIYYYRTILQGRDERRKWLNDRLSSIQQVVLENLGGSLVLKSYHGRTPPHYDPADPSSDPGYSDLLADDYLRYRLDRELSRYIAKLGGAEKLRTRLLLAVYTFAGLSIVLAAIGGSLGLWVAFTTAIASALTAWLSLSQIESVIQTYNHLIIDVNMIKGRWHSLEPDARNGNEFYRLVLSTEGVLTRQHSSFLVEPATTTDDLDLVMQVVRMPAPAALDDALLKKDKPVAEPATAASAKADGHGKATPAPASTPVPATSASPSPTAKRQAKQGKPHAFVVMPFGRKQAGDGRWLDFNAIYHNLIKPAMEEAGFEPFRADEEAVSGDILTDMFQELLLADLVIADLSIDNANVFYELGVRHAMRKRGLIHIQSGRSYMPFDIFNVRTIPYHTDNNGKPDPDFLEKDKQTIIKIARETWASDQDRVHSPIFNLLTGLTEPDRRALRTPLATGFWREYNEWRDRVTIAQRQKRIGDVLLLTEEIQNPLIQEEAISEAGKALKSMGRHELALRQYRRGIEINARSVEFRREEAFHLNRLKRSDEAIVKLEKLLQDEPAHIEGITYLGTIYRGVWEDEWKKLPDAKLRLKQAYAAAHWLKKAVNTYLTGYRLDQNHTYSGVNAYSLSALLLHIVEQVGEDDDPEIKVISDGMPALRGAVQFALESTIQRNPSDYWALVSLAQITLCTTNDPKLVTRDYKKALTAVRKNMYNLESALNVLNVFDELQYRPANVKAGSAVLRDELNKIRAEKEGEETLAEEPPQVFLFSGHRIDLPDRPTPRFPGEMEREARERIEQALDKFKGNSNDLAITAGAACGGDIIFIEACLNRNMKVEVHLPFAEADFIDESIAYAGDKWVERFYSLRNHPNVTIHLQPDRVGNPPNGVNAFSRNNRWALYSALIYGIERVRLIVLWDGKQESESSARASHMVQEVRMLGGVLEHLNTTKFDYWKAKGKVGKALDILAKST